MYAEAYEAELRRRGYTRRTRVNLLRQVARLSRWVEANGFAVGELTGERIDEFLPCQKATGRHRASWSRPALVCLLDVLSGLGVLRPATTARLDSPTELLLASLQRYLLSERALTAGTVGGYVTHARRFLDGLPPGSDLVGVSAADVTVSVLRHASAGSVSAAQNFVAGLRPFLRFCFLEGLVDVDLSQATLSVTGRRRSSLPRGSPRRRRGRCWTVATVAPGSGAATTQ
jgi:hypothetical protein